MYLAYLIALIPLIVGGVLWFRNREVNLWEWVGGAAIGFALSGIFHFVAIHGMTADTETWSGRITQATHHPYWHASWWETETYDCGTEDNPQTCTRMVHKTASYPEHWTVDVSYGAKSGSYEVSRAFWNRICGEFGVTRPRAEKGYRPDMDSGDSNDYFADNHTGVIVPTNTTYHFENRVQATPSLFSFVKVPENVGYKYPEAPSWDRSARLVGLAQSAINLRAWDTLNSELGPTKKVNLILVGYSDADSSVAHTLEAKWIGGKKNDLVLTYGGVGDDGKPTWSYVFGWTEANLVKQNLQTILLDNPVNDAILPKIKEEVARNYQLKDWDKFAYLTVEPPGWTFIVLLLVMGGAQFGFWWWAHRNEFAREEGSRYA